MKAIRIMYIEYKGEGLTGNARIGRVTFSKTGRTVYYGGMELHKYGGGFKSNYWEEETGDKYWISGCKKEGGDRLYNEKDPVYIDDDVREEYWLTIRNLPEYVSRNVAN